MAPRETERDSPPAAPQAARRSPFPHTPRLRHPTPRRTHKEGRSFPKRPAFRFVGVHPSVLKRIGDPIENTRESQRDGESVHVSRYPQSAYLVKNNVMESADHILKICVFADYEQCFVC